MASITVKNIPEPLLRQLRRVAESSNRSLNRQIIECLERQLQPRTVDVDATIRRARALRARGAGSVSLRELRAARREGRA